MAFDGENNLAALNASQDLLHHLLGYSFWHEQSNGVVRLDHRITDRSLQIRVTFGCDNCSDFTNLLIALEYKKSISFQGVGGLDKMHSHINYGRKLRESSCWGSCRISNSLARVAVLKSAFSCKKGSTSPNCSNTCCIISHLQSAYDIAVGMETANRQASELHASARTPGPLLHAQVRRLGVGSHKSAGVDPQSCYRCGKSGHHPDKCFFKQQKCRACSNVAKLCRSKEAFHGTARPNATPRQSTSGKTPSNLTSCVGQDVNDTVTVSTSETESPEGGDEGLFNVSKAEGNPDSAIVVEPLVSGVTLKMELDTGASVSLVSEKVWKETFLGQELSKSDVLLRTYTGERLHVLGQMQTRVTYNGQ